MEEAYIDSNIFLNSILDTGIKGKRAAKILEKVRKGEMRAATSVLTFDEVFWKVKGNKSYEDAITASEAFLNFPNLRFIDVSIDTLFLAFKIIKEKNLDPRDAIHASCALSAGIYLILSDDSDFDKIDSLRRKGIAD